MSGIVQFGTPLLVFVGMSGFGGFCYYQIPENVYSGFCCKIFWQIEIKLLKQ